MSDLAFVRRCTSGDKEAWNEFVEQYSRLIYNYIHSALRIKGVAASQDNISELFQEIFLSITKDNFSKLKSFKARNGCSLASWLRQVTVNRTIDYVRALRPSISIDEESEDGSALKDMLADGIPDPRDNQSVNERLAGLEQCIRGLNKDDKLFVELHFNRRVDLGKLMKYLRISRGAADMRKGRIIQRLKECFREKGLLLDS